MTYLKIGAALCFMLVAAMLGGWPLDFLFTVLVGWIWFLGRVAGNIQVNLSGVGMALLCLVLLAGLLHGFAGWLYRQMSKADPPRPWRFRWTASILGAIVLMFAAGVAAIGLTHQTVWLATSPEPILDSGSLRKAAARANSQNNLKQFGIGMWNLDREGKPIGVLADSQGQMLHGWMTQLLPHIEHGPLYKKIDLSKPWHHPANAAAMQAVVKPYLHPAIEETSKNDMALSHYAGNVHVLGYRMPRFTDGFPDGTSNTILIGEVSSNLKPWGHPAGWRDPALGVHTSPNGFGGPTKGRTAFLMADGSVRTVTDKVSRSTLKAASTPAGNEVLGDDW
jgi:hypothetical protein